MADQTKVLKVLAAAKSPLSITEICQALDPKADNAAHSPRRRQVINLLGKLFSKKLIWRRTATSKFGPRDVFYGATDAGRELINLGGRITSGPKGAMTGINKPRAVATIRQLFWTALRIKKKATVAEIVEIIRRPGDPDAEKMIDNVRRWLNRLSEAGIVARLSVRARGYAPTSNGSLRFALVRDLGAIAPSAAAKCVHDHNARERIAYREKT